jgi:hypothetical protein
MLTWKHRRANGGTMIFMRALWASGLLYVGTLVGREILDPLKAWTPDFTIARTTVLSTLPWFGAFFGAIYAALYSRFSSQWTYLAGLYNQIMAAAVRPDAQQSVLADWQAGFIEDAEDLHLATKPMYATVLANMIADDETRKSYEKTVAGGVARLNSLEEDVKRVTSDVERKWARKQTSESAVKAATGLPHLPEKPPALGKAGLDVDD